MPASVVGIIADAHRRCDDTRQHGQCVLETKKERQEHGHLVVQAEERSCTALLFHEGQIWLEEEGIIVCSDEALSAPL